MMIDASQAAAYLASEKLCPVCGANAFVQRAKDARRYECGAVYAYSDILKEIVAREPCNSESLNMARLMNKLALKMQTPAGETVQTTPGESMEARSATGTSPVDLASTAIDYLFFIIRNRPSPEGDLPRQTWLNHAFAVEDAAKRVENAFSALLKEGRAS